MAEFSMPWNGTATGDATSAPYDANTEWANYIRSIMGIGAQRNDAGVVLGSGSESAQLQGLQVTQNSPAAANVLVNIGNALVHGTWYQNTSTVQLTVAANASGNPRSDTVVLRKTWASQQVRAVLIQGTPAASPVPPNLTQSDGTTWDIPLADIAVANGFVTITNANITPRAIPIDAADGVYLDSINNGTGAVNQTGDVLLLNGTAGRQVSAPVITANTLRGRGFGAWMGRTANAGNGRLITRGIGYVRTSAAVAAGQFGQISATARAVAPSNMRLVNTICMFLETTSGAGLALAYIDPDLFGDTFAPLAASNILGAPAAAIAITDLPNLETYESIIIELFLRSAVAAASDVVSLRFGGTGGLDTTAGNYNSYAGFISNSAPALTAVQNLGATAGIQMAIAGATAPANLFTYGVLQVGAHGQSQTGNNKIVTGHSFFQTGVLNGNLQPNIIGGRWVDTANSVNQLSLISNGGSNLAAGSYINVFVKLVK